MEIATSLLTYLFLFLNAWNIEDQDKYEYFTIKVDSVSTSESAEMTDLVTLEFYGTIGSNGKYSFEKFEIVKKELVTEIRVVGKFNKSAKYGTTALKKMNGLKYSLKPSKKGELILHIIQPDNSYIEKKIQIL